MTYTYKWLGLLFACLVCINVSAVVDTVRTSAGDQLIVTYNVSVSGGKAKVEFVNARKLLGNTNKRKYPDLTKVVPVFFDKSSTRGVDFEGKSTQPFRTPEGVNYKKSADGFFILHPEDMPTLSFEVGQKTDAVVTIPIYLASHESSFKLLKMKSEGSYDVFAKCSDLQIKLKPSAAANGGNATPPPPGTVGPDGRKIVGYREEVGYEQEVVDEGGGQSFVEGGGALGEEGLGGGGGASGLSPDEEAKILMERIEQLMPMETGNSLSENIMGSINQLNALSSKIVDPELRGKANQTLNESYSKKAQLEQNAKDKEQAKNDSIAAEQKAEADKAQSRNLWMIIGGIALAILGFIGNQVLQHFRSLKNLKNMEAMQANAMKKAEEEAKKRTQEAIKQQTQKAEEALKQRGQGANGATDPNKSAAANAQRSNNPTQPGSPQNPTNPTGTKTVVIGGKTYQVKSKVNRNNPQQPPKGSNRDNKDIKI